MLGLNPDPGMSYALADRFTCAICGNSPKVKSVEGSGPITVALECCGKTHKGSYTKEQLVFTQLLFKEGSDAE
jgi:hypothetical protein